MRDSKQPPDAHARLEMKTAGLLLAAGVSSRMGRPKQLLPLEGKTLLQVVLGQALASDLDRVVLVLGHRAAEIQDVLGPMMDHPKLTVVQNSRYKEGISTSLLAGMALVEGACDHLMILLADMPHIHRKLINHLLSSYLKSGRLLGAVSVNGRRSHPVIFGRKLFPELHRLEGDEGARSLFERYSDETCLVEVDFFYDDQDIDTPEDYRLLKETFGKPPHWKTGSDTALILSETFARESPPGLKSGGILMHEHLFEGIQIEEIPLKNRLIMAPLFLGYAGSGGEVSPLLLEHYRMMSRSGVAMVVVENATVDYALGSGSPRTLRVDTDAHLQGLSELSRAIKGEGALSCLQINHAGRFAAAPEPVAPSDVDTFGRRPRPLTKGEIKGIVRQFVESALRVKKAGFDMVELHGGTGYLLSAFVSPHTNRRTDEYGGPLENRMRFPLEVFHEVKGAVGRYPVGYRFLADEWLPGGLKPDESIQLARALSDAGVAYLSVMGGTYESFWLPEIIEKSKQPGYMADLAAIVKRQVRVPVVAAGRISGGSLAERILVEEKADLIGLARVLWADPEWPQKVRENREEDIVLCDPECEACTRLVTKGKSAFCVRWTHDKMRALKEDFE